MILRFFTVELSVVRFARALISRQILLNTLMISKILESDNYNECLPLIKLIMLLLELCSLSQLIIQLSQLIAPRLSICRSVVY